MSTWKFIWNYVLTWKFIWYYVLTWKFIGNYVLTWKFNWNYVDVKIQDTQNSFEIMFWRENSFDIMFWRENSFEIMFRLENSFEIMFWRENSFEIDLISCFHKKSSLVNVYRLLFIFSQIKFWKFAFLQEKSSRFIWNYVLTWKFI